MDNNHQQKCGMFRLCRRCLSGWALFAGDVVGVSMHDLPLAVLAAVDVGDAQGIWLDRHAVLVLHELPGLAPAGDLHRE